MLHAVDLILRGELVAFPTETVYGLGADATNDKAVSKIFEAKARPFEDPLIVHIADLGQLEMIAEPLSPLASVLFEKLAQKFWPGPLTFLFKKKSALSPKVSGGLDTVAVRMPRNLIALALLKNTKRPIAAPSANRFQSLSPTTAAAVEGELGERISLILDGGPCQVGVESTVLALEGGLKILRPGGVSLEDIESVIEMEVGAYDTVNTGLATLAAPGMMNFHYAPRKPLKLYSVDELERELTKKTFQKQATKTALLCFSGAQQRKFSKAGFEKIYVLSPRANLTEAAQNLFARLRSIDGTTAQRIAALRCPDERLGVALNDRLHKAEHDE